MRDSGRENRIDSVTFQENGLKSRRSQILLITLPFVFRLAWSQLKMKRATKANRKKMNYWLLTGTMTTRSCAISLHEIWPLLTTCWILLTIIHIFIFAIYMMCKFDSLKWNGSHVKTLQLKTSTEEVSSWNHRGDWWGLNGVLRGRGLKKTLIWTYYKSYRFFRNFPSWTSSTHHICVYDSGRTFVFVCPCNHL
jgi:hypothetical protein